MDIQWSLHLHKDTIFLFAGLHHTFRNFKVLQSEKKLNLSPKYRKLA